MTDKRPGSGAHGVVALIPARGGSKGVPKKNIAPLGGHPLIAYSIAAAARCPDIARVIVSTDAPDIAECARAYGAETPFLRPAPLAQDGSTDLDVVVHALEWLAAHEGLRPELLVLLRPTTPLRDPAQPSPSSAPGVSPVCSSRQGQHDAIFTSCRQVRGPALPDWQCDLAFV